MSLGAVTWRCCVGLSLLGLGAGCQADATAGTCVAGCAGSTGTGGSSAGGGVPTVAAGAMSVGGGGGTQGAGAPGNGGQAGNGGGGGAPSLSTNPLPPSYGSHEYTLPEPNDSASCSGAQNESAKLEHFAFAQTHVFEPGWPLFFLVAERPALVEAVVTGAGPAPDVRVQAFIDGSAVGELCLKGPATLPATVDFTQHRKTDRYTATLPAKWLRAGLSVKVTAGGASREFSAEQLGVGPAPDLNLVMLPMDVLNYDEGKKDIAIPATWLEDFAGAVPAARLRFGLFPGRVVLSPFVVSDDGDAGVAPTKLTKRPCRDNESAGPSCESSAIPDGNINGAALRVISAIHRATGEFAYAYYYGNTENFFPGGWGGGKDFVGADFDDVFIHEMGHALSLPHWGEGPYQNMNPDVGDYRYPYGGNGNDGGGRGDTWNYYQNIGEYTSPMCLEPNNKWFGKERSDAMQRNAHCVEWRSGGKGPWDGFGDFSALATFRFMTGASESAGMVPYRGGQAPYHLSPQTGFANLVVDAQGKRSLVRAHQPAAMLAEEKYDFLVPQAWDVPVATIYGSYHSSYAEADVLYAPIEYQGTLPRVLDPTDPKTFAELAAADGPYADHFWWPHDLSIKVVYADGHELVALLANQDMDREAALGSGPWRRDLVYFAVNVPRDQPISRVELYERPFVVRNPSMTDAGNIRNPALGITAATFMKDAKLLTSWSGH